MSIRARRLSIRSLLATLPLVFASCFSGGEDAGHNQPIDGGLIVVSAQGKSFQQGSQGPLAGPDEHPVLVNRFSYDFAIDTVEVTQAAFAQLMGWNPVEEGSAYGSGDRFPVYNVSWFDAALYCNARSKAAGMDTVYAYTAAERAPGGSVFNLAGLAVHLQARGFRLPTEAEWEFAARAGSTDDFTWGTLGDSALAPGYAWYSGNSQGNAHPVAGLKPNAFGLYDMAGNVMEWVNDWKGAYPDSGSQDFAGARDPGPEFDAPVKGGAFKYGIRALRPSSRTATYATIRSATAEYVGFRCAIGVIARPRFSTADGSLAQTDPITLDIARPQGLLGGRPAKLVLVNATPSVRHLVYVDYRRYPPATREYNDADDVFYPVISPDGEWVAYGTALEGAGSGSSLYLRRLDSASAPKRIGEGFLPRWWVDPADRDTFLVYTSSAADNSQRQWKSTQTWIQKISGGRAVGSPHNLDADGGFHDGRSKDGRYLATGFRFLKVRDLRYDFTRTLFTAPGNGKEEGDTSQVCNVSMAPDSSGRTLFLDFGYDGQSRITGSYYDIHAVAFVSDPEGHVKAWYRAPSGLKGWEDLEWSNQIDFAISSSTDASDRHQHLYLLNLKDSVFTRIASGTDLATPGLWLGPAPDIIPTGGLALDSLGRYNDPATDAYQAILADRLTRFWSRHGNLEMIFAASSHGHVGLDAHYISRLQTLNMSYPAAGWLGVENIAVNYALNHCPKLKVMVMEVFPGWLGKPGGDFTWANQMSLSTGALYDKSHQYWKDGLPFRFEDLVKQVPQPNVDGDSVGTVHIASGSWGSPFEPAEPNYAVSSAEYQANIKRIEAVARAFSERKIHLVLLNFPTNPAYKNTRWYGPYGPDSTTGRQVIGRIREMEKISSYVHFYDANDFNRHDYTDDEASNWGHLSSQGAVKLTTRLDSLVNAILP